MGKSSTLKQLPDLLGARYLPILCDLQIRGFSASTAIFLGKIADEIAKAMNARGLPMRKLSYEQLQEASKRSETEVYYQFERWFELLEPVLEQQPGRGDEVPPRRHLRPGQGAALQRVLPARRRRLRDRRAGRVWWRVPVAWRNCSISGEVARAGWASRRPSQRFGAVFFGQCGICSEQLPRETGRPA